MGRKVNREVDYERKDWDQDRDLVQLLVFLQSLGFFSIFCFLTHWYFWLLIVVAGRCTACGMAC